MLDQPVSLAESELLVGLFDGQWVDWFSGPIRVSDGRELAPPETPKPIQWLMGYLGQSDEVEVVSPNGTTAVVFCDGILLLDRHVWVPVYDYVG